MENKQVEPCSTQEHKPSRAEAYFEAALWNSRFVVLIAVIASLITAFGVFYLTSVDIFYTISHLTHYHELDDT